jgi:glyoxylase-like metal-dependent hydrolase (beta-lactamase superfamily II)
MIVHMPVSRTVGSAEVIALEDGAGEFFQPRREVFPSVTEETWRRADALDPGAVTADERWWLRFRCFAVRLDNGDTILIDAGIGPVDAPAAAWAPVPGQLPEELAAAGISVDEVSTVVLTHLHTDHVGWAVVGGTPYFRNARFVLQRAEYDAVDTLNPALRTTLLTPLEHSGQLHLVNDSTTLGRGVSTVHTPGHTPGHQCVLIDDGGKVVAVTGDLLVHAVQLVDPTAPYAIESDQAAARDSRVRLLDSLAAIGATIATAHLTEPFRPASLTPASEAGG